MRDFPDSMPLLPEKRDKPLQVSWVINNSWGKPCSYPFTKVIGDQQLMRPFVGWLETAQPDIVGVM